MQIDQILEQIYTLSTASKESLKINIEEVTYQKGYILFRADKIEKNIYFIKKGIVRAYTNMNDNEITFWFGIEGDPVISMGSYVANEKGYEDIELLEDCALYKIDSKTLAELYAKDIGIANWGRKFAEHELLKTEQRLISRQFKTATERYQELLTLSPELIKRVQLAYIASYLGITQVSLSRIRSSIR